MSEKKNVDRRVFLKNSIAISAGAALGMRSFEEQNLLARMSMGAGTDKSVQAAVVRLSDSEVRIRCSTKKGGQL